MHILNDSSSSQGARPAHMHTVTMRSQLSSINSRISGVYACAVNGQRVSPSGQPGAAELNRNRMKSGARDAHTGFVSSASIAAKTKLWMSNMSILCTSVIDIMLFSDAVQGEITSGIASRVPCCYHNSSRDIRNGVQQVIYTHLRSRQHTPGVNMTDHPLHPIHRSGLPDEDLKLPKLIHEGLVIELGAGPGQVFCWGMSQKNIGYIKPVCVTDRKYQPK